MCIYVYVERERERERETHTQILLFCLMKNEHYIFSLQAQRSIQPTDIEGIEQGIEANSALNPNFCKSYLNTPFIIISKIHINTQIAFFWN